MAKQAKNTAQSLSAHLETQKITLLDYAKSLGVTDERLALKSDTTLILIVGGRPYIQATHYEKPGAFSPDTSVLTFKTLVGQKYGGQISAFIEQFGESKQFVDDAVAGDYYWIQGEIFEPLHAIERMKATPLQQYVDNVTNGNAAAFSRAYNIRQQQMHRWISRDCMFCEGEVYLRRTSILTKNLTSAEAIYLSDHINLNYGIGDDGVKQFASAHSLVPQQVKRYLSYDSLWILGDVYKNQSKFKESGITPELSKAFKTEKSKGCKGQATA
jgi:hypothetical protein